MSRLEKETGSLRAESHSNLDEEISSASRAHLPVIVMSGHADMEDVSDMLRLQVLDLFRKPIYHVRLLETLDNLFPKPRVEAG